MIGRRARGVFRAINSNGGHGPGAKPPAGDLILSVEQLTISFDGFTVLNELDFSMKYGEMRFLIGPNGAGKTTLIDAITGKSKPDRGRILFDGSADLTRQQEHQLVRLGIGRKFQTPSIFGSLTVYQNVEVALGFRSRITGLLGGSRRRDSDRIMATLEEVGLAARAGDVAGALSHGEKQWLEIGMLLVQEPKLLLMDEPVAGMTRRERERTGELLQVHRQFPLRPGGGTRHGVRAAVRRNGNRAAPGPRAQRGNNGNGAAGPGGSPRLPGPRRFRPANGG